MSSETRSHSREIELPASPETVFDALIRPSAICKWRQASSAIVHPEKGGYWVGTWGDTDDPDYIVQYAIADIERPRFIEFRDPRYFTRFDPPPFEMNMTTRFEVEPTAEGSVLRVIQDGFPADPAADEFYAACEKGWKDTFDGMENFIKEMSER